MADASRGLWVVVLLPALLAQAPANGDDADPKAKRERTIAIYREEARGYKIWRDASREEELKLVPEPVFAWTNPSANGGQDGAIFVWAARGRPEALGAFFVQPPTGRREIIHELHSLALSTLSVDRSGAHTWVPEAPGIQLTPIPGAPAPAIESAARLVQMRSLLREFSGHTVEFNGQRWDLRALTQPLYRYKSSDPAVMDGALFALVSSAGNDPEALVLIEARRPSAGAPPVWQSGYARFTDDSLSLRHKGVEVYTAPLITFPIVKEDVKYRYRLFTDRFIEGEDGQTSADQSRPPRN